MNARKKWTVLIDRKSRPDQTVRLSTDFRLLNPGLAPTVRWIDPNNVKISCQMGEDIMSSLPDGLPSLRSQADYTYVRKIRLIVQSIRLTHPSMVLFLRAISLDGTVNGPSKTAVLHGDSEQSAQTSPKVGSPF